MDTSDPEITFDEKGICNHCRNFKKNIFPKWNNDIKSKLKLQSVVKEIRQSSKDRDYDCILGLSGGIDSSFLALKVKDLGLNPLVVHVDAGWNSELAVSNIEKIVKYCGFELHTHVMNWDEMRDLQQAYLRAGIANQDVPQDHAFFSSIYHFAIKNKINNVLSGGNIATESIFPDAWHNSAMDAINIKSIHKRFGKTPLKYFKTISFFQYYFWYPFVKKMKVYRLLDLIDYKRDDAISELEEKIGWRSYGNKHGESFFTRFFQSYYLPTRFGYDKRRPHFSSLIVSKQMSREDALRELQTSPFNPTELETNIIYFCKKIGVSRSEFNSFISQPIQDYTNFSNWDKRYMLLKKIQRFVELITKTRFNFYS